MIKAGTVPGLCSALAACVVLTLALAAAGCGSGSSDMVELQQLKSGTTEVVVLVPPGGLKHGKNDFLVEFRSNGALTDVGNDVRASANMPMPGMPMFASLDVQRGDASGRYRVTGDFDMAGAWRMTIEWIGPDGRQSVGFTPTVQ